MLELEKVTDWMNPILANYELESLRVCQHVILKNESSKYFRGAKIMKYKIKAVFEIRLSLIF